MPKQKEIIYSFDKQEISKKGMFNIPNNIPHSIPYFIPNNSQTPHEQCTSNAPKHKTINNKLNNIVNTNVFTHTKNQNKNYDDVLLSYNTICLELSKALKLSLKRKKQIDKMFYLGYSFEDFKKVFENANKSTFLCGKTKNSRWRANFDWLIEEKNFLKVLEGTYQDLDKPQITIYSDLEHEKHSISDEKNGGIENGSNKRDTRHICTEYPE